MIDVIVGTSILFVDEIDTQRFTDHWELSINIAKMVEVGLLHVIGFKTLLNIFSSIVTNSPLHYSSLSLVYS